MKNLLNNRFAPLTYQIGFLRANFREVLEMFLSWQTELGQPVGRKPEPSLISSDLANALSKLDPLTTPPNKVLLIETRSPWIAYFDNGLRVSDPEAPVGYLCSIVPCQGVVVHCFPDRSKTDDPEAIRVYGAVTFTLFGPDQTDWLNRERAIVSMNDGGSWVFVAEGQQQPFEEPERYAEPTICDRFTDAMLTEYCKALDIDVFNEEFYGGRAALVDTIQQLPANSPVMSLKEANRLALI